MNSIDIRTEKANAIFRYRSIQRITTLFRFMEICVFIVVISTFLFQFPISVRILVDHFRGISFESFSPKLVFVIGNVIILILVFKSRVAENGDRYGRIDVYDEYVKRCEKGVVNSTNDVVEVNETHERKICRSQSEKMMRVERNDSQTHRKMTSSVTDGKILLKNVEYCCGRTPAPQICRSQSDKMMRIECNDIQTDRKMTSSVTERKVMKGVDCFVGKTPVPEICRSQLEKMMRIECTESQSRRKVTSSVTERKIVKGVDCFGGKTPAPEICRSQSEKMMRVECRDSESRRRLRRSVTEGKIPKKGGCCGRDTPPPPLAERCGVDELSSEAFRRTVEAFIERQQRSLRDEELAPVTYVGE